MKILLINKFLYPKGGDAISTINTGRLLQSKGHDVLFWGMDFPNNPDYEFKEYFIPHIDLNNVKGLRGQFKAAVNLLYSFEAKKRIERLIEVKKPDIVHLNNFAHQISPSILHIFKKYNIPVVMTMRDYKIVCPVYSMLSNGRVCEECKDGKYYNCFLKGCVKDSRAKSLLNTIEMYLHHKIIRIYDLVDMFISPSRFLKAKLEEMGFKRKIVYLPNFVNVDEYTPQYEASEKSVVYFGRLSKEKGLFTLIEAVRGLDVKLKIIGDGPIREALCSRLKALGYKHEALGDRLKAPGERGSIYLQPSAFSLQPTTFSLQPTTITFLGYKTGEELKDEIRKSMFIVVPSEWYENNPRSVIEAFALGKPVIGARIGGIPELVKNGETGYLFESGSVEDLRGKIKSLIDNPDKIIGMGKNARRFVGEELNAERHYQGLMEIYEEAIGFRM